MLYFSLGTLIVVLWASGCPSINKTSDSDSDSDCYKINVNMAKPILMLHLWSKQNNQKTLDPFSPSSSTLSNRNRFFKRAAIFFRIILYNIVFYS